MAPVLKILGVPRLPPGGSLGTGKRDTVPKIWRAVLICLVRVNGVLVTSIQRGNYIVCLSVESTLNEENDRSLQLLYTCQVFLSQMRVHVFSSCHDWYFKKCSKKISAICRKCLQMF